jgi:hypothetical protein
MAWVRLIDGDASLDAISDVSVTGITSGEILGWTGSTWENQTLAELGIAATSHSHNLTGFNLDTETISSGSITLTNSYTAVAAESGTSDQLDNITAGTNGELAVISADSGDTITVRTVGNINTISGSNESINQDDYMTLLCDGTSWWQIGGTTGYSSGGSSHNLLSATHTDTVTNTVSQGSLIYGNNTPAWDELTIGATDTFLKETSGAPAWFDLYGANNTWSGTSTFQDVVDFEDFIQGSSSEDTISSGVLTATRSFIQVGAESGTADILSTINSHVDDRILFLQAATGDTITVTTAGNIVTATGQSITMTGDTLLMLYGIGSNWYQIAGNLGIRSGFKQYAQDTTDISTGAWTPSTTTVTWHVPTGSLITFSGLDSAKTYEIDLFGHMNGFITAGGSGGGRTRITRSGTVLSMCEICDRDVTSGNKTSWVNQGFDRVTGSTSYSYRLEFYHDGSGSSSWQFSHWYLQGVCYEVAT